MRGFALRDTLDTDEGVSLARVAGWSTAEYSWSFIPKIRGSYPLADPEIETGFPFGLYRASRKATVDGNVIVWPKTVMLAGLPDAVESSQSDDQLADRRVGDFGDMLGTRTFRSGDSLRRVHWAQTARQQQMIVCERQAPATTAVSVTLDVDADSFPDVSPGNRDPGNSLELAVQVTASVCESLHRQHCRVELSLNDQRLVAGESASSFRRLMDELSQATLAAKASAPGLRRHQQSFEILVTSSCGLSGTGLKRPGQHIISVSNHGIAGATSMSSAWITLDSSPDAEMHLQRQWKGACNVR